MFKKKRGVSILPILLPFPSFFEPTLTRTHPSTDTALIGAAGGLYGAKSNGPFSTVRLLQQSNCLFSSILAPLNSMFHPAVRTMF